MTGADFEGLVRWQQAKASRSITISSERYGQQGVSAFVYDYELKVGQLVSCAEEIDLLEKLKQKRAELRAEYDVFDEEKANP